ncbi:hypothetical protein EG349_12060 [Chryseobacterium shandongense]|uniref:Bacteriocin n=1 Tax=Chryseobacterium shandongense TaxID=1493872 RepID=A0A3G6R287_9FLAO|nr:hypothetical protein [Chryseobacterium shandongense]AZA59296.1 hypothetical protein EG350_19795 [Chryseobacterium shandongense]AZA87474.1 hypothetical protein EG349_12060 [Chryseobacterium shandongense]AZA95975.1 hypothetical protein EG353_10525 [Chryseobacterium shandongense]
MKKQDQKQTGKKLSLKKLQMAKITSGLSSIIGGSNQSLSFDDQTTGGTSVKNDKPKDTIMMGYM